MAADPSLVVRIAANLQVLKAALAEGGEHIKITTAGMARLAASLEGNKLEQRAVNITAAVQAIGGVTKLTEKEQARLNATLTEYIEKADRMGREVPPAIRALAQETTKLDAATAHAGHTAMSLKDQYVEIFSGAATKGMHGLGTGILDDAKAITAAVTQIGGASKLTDIEQAKVNKTVTEALAKYKAMGQEAPKAMRDLADATKHVESGTQSWGATLNGFLAGAVAGITVKVIELGQQLLRTAVQGFGEMIARGSKIAGMREGFIALAGGVDEADARMNAMRSSTRGLIGDLEIMQSSNRAMLLGLNLNAAQMGDLAKTATVLGRSMGLDATTALDDLVRALGRTSPLILDNLGLTVKVGEANEIYAKQLRKATSELTSAEQKQAFMNAALDAAKEKVTIIGGLHLTASEQISQLGTSFWNVVTAAGEWLVTLPKVNAALEDLNISLSTLAALREGPSASLEHYRKSIGEIPPEISALTDALKGMKPSVDGVALSMEKMDAVEKKLNKSIEDGIKARKDTAKAIDDAADATERWEESKRKSREELIRMDIWLTKFNANLSVSGDQLLDATAAAMRMATALNQIPLVVKDFPGLFSRMIVPLKEIVKAVPSKEQWQASWDGLRTGLTGVLDQIPQILSAAFTGGGGIMGAIKAIGVQLADVLIDAMSERITRSQKLSTAIAAGVAGAVGGAVGGAAGAGAGSTAATIAGVLGAGTLAATGIGLVAVAIFKLWQRNKHLNDEVKKYNAEIEKLRAGLIEQYGSLQRLEGISQALGLSFEANWGHQGQAGLAAFNALIKEFDARLSNANKQFTPLLAQADQLGIRLPNALLASIQQLADLGVLTEDNIALLDRLTGAADVDWKKMQEAAERYGISIDSLGQQFNQLRLNASAQQIINDFDLLIRGGADVGTVLSGMADEISLLAQKSIQFGTTIPENMRAWIEELIRSGQLLDENGAAITDITKLKFGEPIQTEFERITEALEKLISTLDRFADTLSNLPRPNIELPDVPEGGWNPELPGGHRPIPLATGGDFMVSRPTLFMAGEAGPERATFTPMSQSRGSSRSIPVQVVLPNGRVLLDFIIDEAGDRFAVRGR